MKSIIISSTKCYSIFFEQTLSLLINFKPLKSTLFMRKLLFTLGTLLLLFIASACSKDDDDSNDPIVGTWEIRETYENYKLYNRFTFNSNQTGEYYYTEAENGEEIDENIEEELEQFTYSITEDKLTISGDEVYKYSISGNKLTLSYKDELRYDEPEVYTRKN